MFTMMYQRASTDGSEPNEIDLRSQVDNQTLICNINYLNVLKTKLTRYQKTYHFIFYVMCSFLT